MEHGEGGGGGRPSARTLRMCLPRTKRCHMTAERYGNGTQLRGRQRKMLLSQEKGRENWGNRGGANNAPFFILRR